MARRSIDTILNDAQLFIGNVLDDEAILQTFAAAGHDRTYFEAGRTLYDQAWQRHTDQQKEYGETAAASDQLDDRREAGQKVYMRHLRLARLAVGEDAAAERTLGLKGARRRKLSEWLDQVLSFYDHLLANEAWTSAMDGFGVSVEELQEAHAAVLAVQRAHRARQRESGEAQAATRERDDAVAELETWHARSRELARILFTDNPQVLEKLGIVVRS